MKYYKFSKISAIWIIIFFIGASITSVFASSNYQIKEEINKLEDQPFHSNIDDPIKEFPSRTKIRIFIFCKIETWTTGRAFLFPGYLDSLDDGINVSKASGLCFVGNKSISDSVKINEIDLANWRWMFIAFYSGYLKNYKLNLPPLPKPVFCLDGNAGLVIVIYNS